MTEIAPSFDSEDLTITLRVLRELAGTYPADSVMATIMVAAANIAASRTHELLSAHLSERGLPHD